MSSYLMAWGTYLLSAIGLVFVFWRMTKNLKLRRTRRSLRSLVAVILFTPINITPGSLWLAPAYLVGSYDWVLGKTEKALEAGIYISVAYILMMFIIMLESVMRRLFGMARAH
mgnify:FL=1